MKRVPYGISDFPNLIREGYYYVDKTRYIELIERQPNFLFLIRPRRFGKSLFLSMLESYYGIDYTDCFQSLFGRLYIGQHPTGRQNRYLILRFNFSSVAPRQTNLAEAFNEYCVMMMTKFIRRYEPILGSDIWLDIHPDMDAGQMLTSITQHIAIKRDCPRIYLMIDEYDNFTNTILSTYGTDSYHEVTHGEGLIRHFFAVIKDATASASSVERLFITGVSPITMDDVTSGFNIGTNISMQPAFNGIIGFSLNEMRAMLAYYIKEGALSTEVSVEGVLEQMKPWYDNYCFSSRKLDERMFNSDMALYFLNSYLQDGVPPETMIDTNIRTDYNKLRHLVKLDHHFGANASVIRSIVEKGSITAEINTSFPATDMTKVENFKSLLFYFGMLSIQGVFRGETVLGIPNLTVREQLYTYLTEAYQRSSHFQIDLDQLSYLVTDMAYDGAWQPVFDFFARELERQSAIREFIEGEAHVKGFLLAYLGLTRGYIILPEYEASKGYADFYMMPDLIHQPEIAYSYIVEVKYALRTASDREIEALMEEAEGQLHRYAADAKVQSSKGDTQLKLLTIVFKGWELVKAVEIRLK